jgi:hypothetical protein
MKPTYFLYSGKLFHASAIESLPEGDQRRIMDTLRSPRFRMEEEDDSDGSTGVKNTPG